MDTKNPFEPQPKPQQNDQVISPKDETWDGMTNADWDALHLPMEWSIYKDGSTDQENPDAWQLDLTTDVEDGEYDVVYGSGEREENPFRKLDYDGRTEGVWVENGEFTFMRQTIDTIYDLVRTFQRGRYNEIVKHGEDMNHKFIERMDYNPLGGYFRVVTGS